MFDCCVDLMFDLVLLSIGSWSPLELAGTWACLGIVIGFWCTAPLEFITLSLRWPPLDMGGRTDVCLCSTGGLVGNSTFGLGASVLQFPKIVRTASIAANCESQLLLGKYLSAADKKYIAWFSLYSSVTSPETQ